MYITRHGESIANLSNIIGGNSSISENGKLYSKKLYDYISKKFNNKEIIIYTSKLNRTKETAKYFRNNKYKIIEFELLNEINAGIFEELTYIEFENINKIEFNKRKNNKLYYKYPKGESYIDLINRVTKFLENINKDKNILIISHSAVIRTILYKLLKINIIDIPYLDVKLNTIFNINNNKLIKFEI